MDDKRDGSRRRHDDPEATGPMWPLPDDDVETRASDDTGRTAHRRAGRPPDAEATTVLPAQDRVADEAADDRLVDPTRVAPDVRRDWLEPQWADEPIVGTQRAGRPRRRRGPRWTRIAAPVVLLVAVIAVVTLTVQSGVIGGKPSKPNPASSKQSGTKPKPKFYRVKNGDSMGTIAEKLTRKMGYTITVDDLLVANPRVSATTINPGLRLKIPPAQ
jgi:LysM domain